MHDSQLSAQLIYLRNVESDDIAFFFRFQSDPEAGYMAGFGGCKPGDLLLHYAQWEIICADQTLIKRTICYDDMVVGNVLCYEHEGRRELGYWIDRAYWGLGIATAALGLFLDQYAHRPLYARCVADNKASQRVLEKNGFQFCAQEQAFSDVRNAEVLELVYMLN